MIDDTTRRSRWERLIDTAVPLWAVGLLVLTGAIVTILFGWILTKPHRHGSLGVAARGIAEIPQTIGTLLSRPPSYRPAIELPYKRLPGGLTRNTAQPFTDPGFLLVSDFDEARSRRVVRLIRLSDGKMVHDYAPDVEAIHAGSTFSSALIDLKRDKPNNRYFPMHPLLTEDGGLILHDTSPLTRVDACGKPEWMVDGIFHHAVERAPDGSYWAAFREPKSTRQGVSPNFADESILQVASDGKILHRESVIDILDRNGLGHLWRGHPYNDDPIHLNDIQPVLVSGPHWQRGDLFLSLRNLSTVMLYRPSTGRILWHRSEPWLFQHDVSIVDDHRISVFDNHWRFAWDQPEQAEVDGNNHVLVYDFASDTISDPLAGALKRLDFHTRAQGRATPLANGDFMLEETEYGRVLRVAPDGTVRWRYIAADSAQRRYELRWSRYLDTIADGIGIQAAEKAKCA